MPIITLVAVGLAMLVSVAALGFHLAAREDAASRAYNSASEGRRRRNALVLVALAFLVVAILSWLVTL